MSNIEDLESTKLSLINSEQLEEIKNNPATKATILLQITPHENHLHGETEPPCRLNRAAVTEERATIMTINVT